MSSNPTTSPWAIAALGSVVAVGVVVVYRQGTYLDLLRFEIKQQREEITEELKQHRGVLEEIKEEFKQHRGVLEEIKEEFKKHRGVLEEIKEEFKKHRGVLEQILAQLAVRSRTSSAGGSSPPQISSIPESSSVHHVSVSSTN